MEFIKIILLGMLPVCGAEDSQNCYWDAQAQGNGDGYSFLDVGGEAYYMGGQAAGRDYAEAWVVLDGQAISAGKFYAGLDACVAALDAYTGAEARWCEIN